jgi:hypothetical protein
MTKKEEALYRETLYRKLKKKSKEFKDWAEKCGEIEDVMSQGTSLIVGPRSRKEFELQMAQIREIKKQNKKK